MGSKSVSTGGEPGRSVSGVSRNGNARSEGSSSSGEDSQSWVGKANSFMHDSVVELKKVTVPSRQETIQATVVTIIIMVFMALCLFLLDVLFGKLMGSLLS